MTSSHSDVDVKLAVICFGWFLGFGWHTVQTAIRQTCRARNPRRSHFIWMIWGELAANVAIAVIAFLLLDGTVKPTLALLFVGLCFWVIETQFLLQIIINRLAVVMIDTQKAARIKWGVAGIMTIINIMVFCIYIPAQLGVNNTYIRINEVEDRVTKILILLIDGVLNWYFIKTVKQRLVDQGLTKYDRLVKFNIKIMCISIGLDLLVVCLMSYPNPLVYLAFQPPAYLVKLNIEMSMADLIAKVARLETRIGTVVVSTEEERGDGRDMPMTRKRYSRTDVEGDEEGWQKGSTLPETSWSRPRAFVVIILVSEMGVRMVFGKWEIGRK